jgi:hypothetical protein
MIEPYLGAAFNVPLSEKLLLPIATPLAGVEIGAKMGRIGAMVFSVEFDYDNDVIYQFGNNEDHAGARIQLFFGIGVKFGYFNRRIQSDEN